MMRIVALLLALLVAPPVSATEPAHCYVAEVPQDAIESQVPNPFFGLDLAMIISNIRLQCGHDVSADRQYFDAIIKHYGCSQASEITKATETVFAGPLSGYTDGGEELRGSDLELYERVCAEFGRCAYPTFDPDASPSLLCRPEIQEFLN